MRHHHPTHLAGLSLLFLTVLLSQSQAARAQHKHSLPLIFPASNTTLQSFVRVINHSGSSGDVTIYAIDDAGERFGPVILRLEAEATRHFNSDSLRDGDVSKGLSSGIGDDGEGNLRLEFETSLDIEPLAYTRPRGEGFVTSTHDVVAEAESMRWHVPIFNPGDNAAQHSWLRVINTADIDTEVVIEGLDDLGALPPGGEVRFSLPANAARMLSAKALEGGSSESDFELEGSFGDGWGKWQLFVSADQPIQVMSLLFSTSGHVANLSTGGPRPTDDPLQADPSIVQYLADSVAQGKSPGLLAAIVDGNGVTAVAAAGVRKQGAASALTVNDMLKINSNTKAMTSTLLATMVADGTFDRGWETTIAEVFPELIGQIHSSYHSVNLRHLLTMTGGIQRNAADWWAYWWSDIVDARYGIMKDNLTNPPEPPVGEYSYSNLGYMIAGAMAESVTGKSWETLIEQRLFTPLGMTTAGFNFQGRAIFQ